MKKIKWIILGVLGLAILLLIGWLSERAFMRTNLGLMMFGQNVSSTTIVSHLDSTDRDLVMTSLGLLSDRHDVSGQAKAYQLLNDQDDYIWLNATLYLGSIGDQKAVPHLIRALGHTASRSYQESATHLQAITGQSYGTDQQKWIDWWQAQNPTQSFEFGFLQYVEEARRLTSDHAYLINHVVGPTTISHSGSKIELVGVQLETGASEPAAIRLLQEAVMFQFVELVTDEDQPMTDEGARRAVVYWVADEINDPALAAMGRQSSGLGAVPFKDKTQVQYYLVDSGLYVYDLGEVTDEEVLDALAEDDKSKP